MKLTQEEIDMLHTWLDASAVGNMDVERPVVHSPARLDTGDVGVVLGGKTKLSETSRRAAENKIVKQKRHEAAVKARAAKLPRGKRHSKAKEATRRRQALHRWTVQPYKSLVYGYGNWAITQEDWDRTVAHLWIEYNPAHLTVKRKWGKGTKVEPYTIYDIDVYFKDTKVYSGQDQLVLDKSVPNDLDIKKAPEGAELFTQEVFLSGKKLRLLGHLSRLGLEL